MKKLFALISLLGLVAGMGGALNAQEASGDTQSKLDTIILYSYFQNPGEAQTLKFKFSATPGEKFVIYWKGFHFSNTTDTISVETEKEIEVAHTFTSDYTHSHPTFNVSLSTLTPDGHFKSLRIDSTYKYSGLTFKNCMLLDSIQVAHNTLTNLRIWNCPLLRFLDISHNKLTGWYQEMTSALTYLDCSHNDIRDIVEKGFTSLETLDCSYNRLRQLRLSDCEALVNLTAIHTDSIRYDSFDLPPYSPLQALTLCDNHALSALNLSQCPNLITLNCSNNTQLKELNLSNNPKLETFNCFNCKQLTYLYINHTSWDSLDVSSFPALETLDCGYNQLSYINLNGLENLMQLFCHHNQLSYICLSDSKNLINVDCRNNLFTSLDIPEGLILNNLLCDSNRIPLSVLADLSRHAKTDWYEISQFPTIAPIQVGNLLDLSGETHLSDYWPYEQYTLFFNGQQIEERFNDGLTDDYGLFTFDKAGNYRLHLKCLLNDGNYAIMSAYYDLTVVDSVVRPQFSIPSGAVVWPDTVLILSTPTPEARIYYTTDGSEPSENALLYQAPISISEPITIKAIAIQDTFKSHIATATYTIDTVARPTFSIPFGAVVWPDTTLILSTATPNAQIYYTIDGGEPDETALAYTAPIRITEAMTVKAVAIYKTFKSQINTASYTIDTVDQPCFSVPPGIIWPNIAVSLSTATRNACIYYTIDGTDPDETASPYQGPVRITEDVLIKAIAIYKTAKSQIASALYAIFTVAQPDFSLPSGPVKRDTLLYISTTTPSASIYYTTDGSEPNENALLYQEPIRITEAMTVKAIAIYTTIKSQVSTASYTVDLANEHDLMASKLRVYAKDRTIHLSETAGKVEVFTLDGHCVYRGYDTAIPVWKSGMYIVSAAGRRWKVAVR